VTYFRFATSAVFAILVMLGTQEGVFSAEYVPDEVIVRFATDAATPPQGKTAGDAAEFSYANPELESLLGVLGVTTLSRVCPEFGHSSVYSVSVTGDSIVLPFDVTDMYVLQLADTNVIATTLALRADTLNVLAASPNWIVHEDFVPSDSLFSDQWGLKNTGQYGGAVGEDIRADGAWNIWTGASSPVSVAILDTGIDPNHPDLNVVLDRNFTSDTATSEDVKGHGTSVAGIVGAKGNNRIGVAGVNWGVELRAVKVMNNEGGGKTSDTAHALDWIRGRAPIANMSFSWDSHAFDVDPVAVSCKNAFAAGVFLVATMGNEDNNERWFPGGFNVPVFAVGAMSKTGDRWTNQVNGCNLDGSQWGSWIDVIAPGGRQVQTTRRVADGSYYATPMATCEGFGGTSAAAPVVAGIASLLKSKANDLTNEDIGEILRRTARDKVLYGVGFDEQSGWGLVSAEDALKFIGGGRVAERNTLAGLTDVGETGLIEMTIFDEPCRSTSGKFWVKRHTLTRHIAFGTSFVGVPDIWIRGNASVGWTANSYHSGTAEPVGWAEVVPGSLTATGCDVRTYVYEVFSYLTVAPLGWCPSSPSGARVAYTAFGPIHQAVDIGQSFYVPQRGSYTSPTEGKPATDLFRTCPNNDGITSFPDKVRIKVVVRDASGSPISGIPATSVFLRLNGGTPGLPPDGQGFRGPGADSIISNQVFSVGESCPNVEFVFADGPTDPNGATYITFGGAGGVRDPMRKWGHYDTEIPVYIYWNAIQGRLTSAGNNGSYVLQIKNVDLSGGLGAYPNQGQIVNSSDFNSLTGHLGQHDSDDPMNWWRDLNNDGNVNSTDYGILTPHMTHSCSSPNAN